MMRALSMLLVAALAACSVRAGGADAQEASGIAAVPADTSAVAFVTAYVASMDSRDAAAIREAIADDGRFVWLEDGAVRYRTVESLLDGLSAFPANVRVRTALSGLTSVPLDERSSHVFGEFATSVGDREGAYRFHGVMTVILERSDGWRVVGGHTSTGSRR